MSKYRHSHDDKDYVDTEAECQCYKCEKKRRRCSRASNHCHACKQEIKSKPKKCKSSPSSYSSSSSRSIFSCNENCCKRNISTIPCEHMGKEGNYVVITVNSFESSTKPKV
jgi:hypothetical protein